MPPHRFQFEDINSNNKTYQVLIIYVVIDVQDIRPPRISASFSFQTYSRFPQWPRINFVKPSAIYSNDYGVSRGQSEI